MNISQITAGIELICCSVRKLSISNNLINLKNDDQMQLDIDMLPLYDGFEDQEHHGRVILHLHITSVRKDKGQDTDISITFEALFRSTTEMEKEIFLEMLTINGSAALYSIARGKLESISASVFEEGKIELPFLNIIEYYREKALEAEANETE